VEEWENEHRFVIPTPAGSSAPDVRSQTPTSMMRGGNGPSSVPSFWGADEIRRERGKQIESPASSARTFIPPHTRSRLDFSGRYGAGKDNITSTTALISKGKAKGEEMGVGNGGLGRQNTITQRSVGTVLLASTSCQCQHAC